MNICSFDPCDCPVHCKGLCNTHYYQQHRGFVLTEFEPKHTRGSTPTCTVSGCDKPHKAKGYCRKHWRQHKPETVQAQKLRRRALMEENGVSDDLALELGMILFFFEECQHPDCHKTEGLQVDHVIPLSKGGYTGMSNFQVLCREHNTKKYTAIIDYRKPPEFYTSPIGKTHVSLTL